MTNSCSDLPLQIDGSFGEGGGSILRVAAGLACVKNQSIAISNIRSNRPNPGLRLQHLVGLQSIANLTQGSLNSLDVGSTEVAFTPGDQWKSSLEVQIRTAGNIGLLTQTLYNSLYLAPRLQEPYQIIVDGGGTYGRYAPSPEYLNHVTYRFLQQMGYKVHIDVEHQGFFPKGGARAIISILPAATLEDYKPLYFEERGELQRIEGVIHVEKRLEKAQVAQRILNSLQSNLISSFSLDPLIKIVSTYDTALSVGVGVDLWCEFSNGVVLGIPTVLGERGVSSEKIGKKAASLMNDLLNSTHTVDEYASDQILPLLCLCQKPSKIKLPRVSSHFKTNLELLDIFFKRDWTLEKAESGFFFEYK